MILDLKWSSMSPLACKIIYSDLVEAGYYYTYMKDCNTVNYLPHREIEGLDNKKIIQVMFIMPKPHL